MVDNPPVERLRTVHLVPLTAFEGPEQRLALEPMRSLTTRLHEAGVKAFIPCAGSAEFYAVSPDEIVAAVEMTHSVVGSSALTIAPIGFQLSTALDVGRRSLEKGAVIERLRGEGRVVARQSREQALEKWGHQPRQSRHRPAPLQQVSTAASPAGCPRPRR